MPIVGTPTTATSVTADDVRRFMRDVPGYVPDTGVISALLDGVEFSDRDIRDAVKFTVNWFTIMTPMIGTYTENMIPSVILLYGVAAHLLTSESTRQLRNQVTVQDGDTQPIGVDDKHQLYLQAAERMRAMFLEYGKAFKIQRNISRAYGGIGSGYAQVSRNHSG